MKSCWIAVALVGAGCSKQQPSCAQQRWSGQCSLVSVTKVEDREHPIPHVVFEARYRPEPNAGSPNYTPAEVTKNFWIASQYELDLYDHLQRQNSVACGLPALPDGACAEPRLAVDVAPFDMARAEQAHTRPNVVGCARIESTSEQDKLALGQNTRTKFPETLLFEANSAALGTDAESTATALAERLKKLPGVECVGIVGQITTGEPLTLAAERARNVRDFLVSRGVAAERVMTIIANTNVYGSGSKPADPDPKQRKVGLTVLLEQAEGQAAGAP